MSLQNVRWDKLDELCQDREYMDQIHKDVRELEIALHDCDFFRNVYRNSLTDLAALQYAISWSKLVSARERLCKIADGVESEKTSIQT